MTAEQIASAVDAGLKLHGWFVTGRVDASLFSEDFFFSDPQVGGVRGNLAGRVASTTPCCCPRFVVDREALNAAHALGRHITTRGSETFPRSDIWRPFRAANSVTRQDQSAFSAPCRPVENVHWIARYLSQSSASSLSNDGRPGVAHWSRQVRGGRGEAIRPGRVQVRWCIQLVLAMLQRAAHA